ncbi:hypothetical protein [Variovorax sp. 67-131]|jgi:hypothetical protein|uniref:hypothetical protein n=1 Tax=Variovorax sp. 67-131 TaxID=1895865 RepID=UPI000A5A26A6|nr:hypothetical protein [Variovorax sp. 67-131]
MTPAYPLFATSHSICAATFALHNHIEPEGRFKHPRRSIIKNVEKLSGSFPIKRGNGLRHAAATINRILIAEADEDAFISRFQQDKGWGNRSKNFSRSERRCVFCVAEDLEHYGFAYSRVLHQFRGVLHCAWHDSPIQDTCAHCGPQFGSTKGGFSTEDLERCKLCGRTAGEDITRPLSEGYAIFSQSLFEAVTGCESLFRPRKRLVDQTLMHLTAARIKTDPLAFFCAAWNAPDLHDVLLLCGCRLDQQRPLERMLSGKRELERRKIDPISIILASNAASLFLSRFANDIPESVAQIDDEFHMKKKPIVEISSRRSRAYGIFEILK